MLAALRGRLPARVALVLAGLFLPVLLYLGILAHFRLDPGPALQPEAARGALGLLRRALDPAAPAPAAADLAALDRAGGRRGPLWLSLFWRGDAVWRQRLDPAAGLGRAVEQGVGKLEQALAEDPELRRVAPEARLKLDLSLGQAPVISSVPLLFAKSVVPGLDGLGLTAGQRSAYLLPDELHHKDLLSGHQPFFFMPEFQTGLSLQTVVDLLADRLDLSLEQWRSLPRRFFRFRVQSYLEPPSGQRPGALPVVRYRVPKPRVRRADVRRAVARAASYVVRQMRENGEFHYVYYPMYDQHSPPGEYSLPRHAGTTWFLSLAYATLKDAEVLAAAKKAIRYLGEHAVPPACQKTPYACVSDSDRRADLGSAALATVAVAEYQLATGDRAFLPLARRLGAFILMMQKKNGDFCHLFTPSSGERSCRDVLLYYSGEATLALAKLHAITGDPRYAEPLERALDFLTGEKYDFFLGSFFISEDHWTCIAAEAAAPVVDRARYARFCYAFAALNRRVQVRPDEALMGDLAGSFAITPFFMPHNTPVGSRSEANVATYLLSQRRGEPQAEVLRTVREAVRYLVDQQLAPPSSYLFPNPAAAEGGLLKTPVQASIRIDYVQHAAAALARALPLIEE